MSFETAYVSFKKGKDAMHDLQNRADKAEKCWKNSIASRLRTSISSWNCDAAFV
jgi:hypothetical protein